MQRLGCSTWGRVGLDRVSTYIMHVPMLTEPKGNNRVDPLVPNKENWGEIVNCRILDAKSEFGSLVGCSCPREPTPNLRYHPTKTPFLSFLPSSALPSLLPLSPLSFIPSPSLWLYLSPFPLLVFLFQVLFVADRNEQLLQDFCLSLSIRNQEKRRE